MSYCVNCGVKLEVGRKECPLCQTPVINPTKKSGEYVPVYAKNEAFVPETKKSKAFTAFVFSVVLLIPNLISILVNILMPSSGIWALYVLMVSFLVWTICIFPMLLPRNKAFPYILLTVDTIVVGGFSLLLLMLLNLTQWFFYLVLPILLVISLFTLYMLLWLGHKNRRRLQIAISVLSVIGILSLVIDIFLNILFKTGVVAFVSLIIVASCSALVIIFAAVSDNKRFYEWVRRKFHM